MEMFYGEIKYTLKTDPPEAMYWHTHQLKKSEIKLLTRMDRTTGARIRQEILDDINSKEDPRRKKQIQKKSQARIPQHVEKRKPKQKARKQSKR